MTQLTVPPPYSLVLLIQVKTPTSIFGEPSFLHLDSFLLLRRERSCRFTGELPNDSLTSHLRSKWMKREGKPHPASSLAQMWGVLGPWVWTTPGAAAAADVIWAEPKLKLLWRRERGAHYQSVKLLFIRVRCRPGRGWFLEVRDKAWSSTLYSSPFVSWFGWLFFLEHLQQRLRSALSKGALTISRGVDNQDLTTAKSVFFDVLLMVYKLWGWRAPRARLYDPHFFSPRLF